MYYKCCGQWYALSHGAVPHYFLKILKVKINIYSINYRKYQSKTRQYKPIQKLWSQFCVGQLNPGYRASPVVYLMPKYVQSIQIQWDALYTKGNRKIELNIELLK